MYSKNKVRRNAVVDAKNNIPGRDDPNPSQFEQELMAMARNEARQVTTKYGPQLETLNEITRELTASLDLGRMLHRTLAEVTTAITAEMGAVFLMNSEAGQLVPETTIGWNREGIPLEVLPPAWQLGQRAVNPTRV